MLRSKAFTKITKKGSVVKVVKEHYLRDDIPCGISGCTLGCNDSIRTSIGAAVNDESTSNLVILMDPLGAPTENSRYPAPHLLIPDTNIFLHHLDILESKPFHNVVVLQTVLDEVRNRNQTIYNRIRSLISRADKKFFVFSNEHHKECFAGNKDSSSTTVESDNDRNDRAIRLATAWYGKHLKEILGETHPSAVVLLTHDVENGRRGRAEDLTVATLADYIEGLIDGNKDALLDMLEAVWKARSEGDNDEEEAKKQGGIIEYPEHLSESVLSSGVSSGKFFQGSFQASPYNPFQGSISTGLEGEMASISITSKLHLNRAIHGDLIVVELLPKEQWVSPAAGDSLTTIKDQEDDHEDGSGMSDKSNDKNEEEIIPQFPPIEAAPTEVPVCKPCGRVVGILKRPYRAYCGSIDRKAVRPNAAVQSILFYPMDRRIPRIRIRTRQAQHLAGLRILVVVDGWERSSHNPSGHFVKELGVAGDRATEIEAILLEHNVAYDKFTPAVLACLPSPDWAPTEADRLARADFRDLDVCSIDPPGCTDIDDALHSLPLPNGNIQVGVHIADVTHFVKAGTAMDLEASSRATTVYLVDRRIDMLPELLGTNLCSLKSNVERFAFSCIWEMTPDAQIVSCSFTKSIIKSKASFTYDEAQKRLDGGSIDDGDALTRSIHRLAALARQMKARRIEAGALTLASPEVRFNIDTDTQNPVDVEVKEMKEANSLVEEFMLLANIWVAKELFKKFPDTAVLRRHPTPPPENFEALNRALAPYDFQLDSSDSKSLALSLDRADIAGDSYFNRLVRIMTTRCMYQAVYFASGTLSEPLFWHYGLATPIYTHFTSPIRRYADVLVHRLLACAISAPGYSTTGLAFDKQLLQDTCSNLNYRNRMAQQAQRSSIELFTHLFFRGKTVLEDAYIIKIMKNAIVCLVPKYGMECIVQLPDSDLKTAGVIYDIELNQFMQGETPVIKLFQHVKVQISVEELEASLRQRLKVELVEPAVFKNVLGDVDVDMDANRPLSPTNSTSSIKRKLEN